MLTATALAMAALLLTATVMPVRGGNCWSGMSRGGRCTDLLQEKVTREQCCALAVGVGSASTAWSDKDMDAGMMFFWRVLGGGVPCQACRDSCAGVSCGPGRRCAVRWGRPQCVCAPDCSHKRLAALYPSTGGASSKRPRGPVCGSDGRSYRSACRLLKRACRRQDSNLAVAYHGTCQSTCDRVHCGAGRSCVQDQNLSPHCVRCERHCPSRVSAGRAVCGADGTTYASACHLRDAACRAGRAIPIAYRGRCQRVASCGAIRCGRHQSCLTDMATGAPRCVTCSMRCPRGHGGHDGHGHGGHGHGGMAAIRRMTTGSAARKRSGGGGSGGGARIRELISLDAATELVQGGPLCGSNNRTYLSWCHMRKDACATGYVIDTRHAGACKDDDEPQPGEEAAPHLNAVLEENNFP